jgi:DNA-binding NtrC family response regulator
LGARKPIDLDVRLLAATNVKLEQAVAAGHFRADLYFRLSVAVLELAPLAQRPGDILMLAEHFVSVYSRRLGLTGVRLGPDACEALLRYSWPGNIRELENVVHYALIVNRDGLIRATDLQLRGMLLVGNAPVAGGAGVAAPTSPIAGLVDPMHALAATFSQLFEAGGPDLAQRVERLLIERAYAHCHRNQVRTAELLGVTRNVLRTQLKRFGLLGGDAGGVAAIIDDATAFPEGVTA